MLRSLLSLVLAAALFGGHAAFACSFRSSTLEQKVDSAEIIFIGCISEVAEIPNSPEGADRFENPPVRARFQVLDSIKGDPTKVQFLRSGYGGGDCGIPFVVGRRYLVYTSQGGQVFLPGGSGDVTPEYEPHRRYIEAIRQYVKNGTKIPATSNPFVQPTGKRQPAADKTR
jgi:hypothetical protein